MMNTPQEQNDALWRYYQSQNPHSFDSSYSRQDYFAQRCPAGSKVLNIGAGSGRLESLLMQRGANVFSVDPCEQTIARLNHELKMNGQARRGYCHSIPFPDCTFDTVILTEVLEHIPQHDLAASLQEIRRVLQPDGRLLGSVPFRENLRDNEIYCPQCHAQFHRWGHLHSFDKTSLGNLILDNGFSIRVLRTQAFPDFSRPGLRPFVRALFRYILGRLGEQLVGPNLYFEARRPVTDARGGSGDR